MLRSILRHLGVPTVGDVPTVAVNVKPVRSPWGGGNQFVIQLERYLESKNCRVVHRLGAGVNVILLVAPRPFQNVVFDVEEIRDFKRKHPGARCVHRINQSNLGRNVQNVDDVFKAANEVADHTVFISRWIQDYFASKWFDTGRPHTVIYNGADPAVFFPNPSRQHTAGAPMRVVTHHWSDNWNKGFAVYQEVDAMIAAGELPGFKFMVIGRWPAGIVWRSAVTNPPVEGRRLAGMLREHDLYLTAAKWEAGGMHHIEAAQCGLPVVFHEDGGGIAELAGIYGVSFRDNVKQALMDARDRYEDLRRRVLSNPPSGAKMCEDYFKVLLP